MARLPGFESQRSVETGSQFMRPRSTTDQTAKAISNIGSTFASVGAQLQSVDDKLALKLEAEAKRTEALEIESDVIRTDTDERLRLQEAKQNVTPSGAGFYNGFMTQHDKTWQERVEAMPPERRAAAEVKFLRNRESLAVDASAFEHSQRQKFVGQVTTEKSGSLTAGIKAGTMDHGAAVADAEGFVDGLALPPNAALVLRRHIGMNIDGARIEREIELNAPGALRDLSKYSAGATRSDNPHVQRIIEAAARHGVPLGVILPGVNGESKFDPTVDMSKKINPKTGKPYSTAYGYGQMIDSNWKEVGLEKSADPDVQAEATARIFKKRIDHLQRNGIEVNATNVWGAHFVGPGGYTALLRADPDRPLRDVLLPMYGDSRYAQATSGNGTLLRDGATVGQTLQAIAGHVKKNEAAVVGLTKTGPAAADGQPIMIGDTVLKYATADDLPRYLAKAQSRAALQSETAMEEVARATVSSGPLDSYNPAHRSDADKAFKSSGIGSRIVQGDTDAVGQAHAFARMNGFVPPDAGYAAQQLMVNVDNSKRVVGYELGLTAYASDIDNGLGFAKFDADMAKRVRLYAAIREGEGVDPVEAVRRVESIFSPENQKAAQTEEFKKATKEKRESLSFSDLSDVAEMKAGTALGRMLGFGYDRTPASDKVQQFMTDRYRDAFEEHAKAFGNTAAAVTAAKNDMKRLIGVTKIFGSEQATLFPPEKMLKALPDGSHTYVRDQAMLLIQNDVLRAKTQQDVPYGQIDPKNLLMKPTGRTWLDKRAGRVPEYDLLYIDKANSMIREVQLGWRPDYNAGYERYKNDVDTAETGGSTGQAAKPPTATGKLGKARQKQEIDAQDARDLAGGGSGPGASTMP